MADPRTAEQGAAEQRMIEIPVEDLKTLCKRALASVVFGEIARVTTGRTSGEEEKEEEARIEALVVKYEGLCEKA